MADALRRYPLDAVLMVPWWALLLLGSGDELVQDKTHWYLFDLAGILLFGWPVLQAVWLRRVDRSSVAVFLYVGLIAGDFLLNVTAARYSGVLDALSALMGVLWLVAIFVFRHEMQRYFREKDPVGLELRPVMTLFFNFVYFQYHFNEIVGYKQRQGEPIRPVSGIGVTPVAG